MGSDPSPRGHVLEKSESRNNIRSIGASGATLRAEQSSFITNYRVENLPPCCRRFAKKAATLGNTDGSEYGKFGWVIDPEGDKIELRQPFAGQ